MNVLKNPELQASLRIIDRAGEPWFVAKDVCDVLGLVNSRRAVEKLDDDEKGVTLSDTLGGVQKMTIVSESGLYALILRSDKPNARAFRKWVTSEVLPQIRRTGSFAGGWESELRRLEQDCDAARALVEDTERKLVDFREGMIQRIGQKPLAMSLPASGKPRIDYRREVSAMPLPMSRQEAIAWGVAHWPGIARRSVEMRLLRMERRGILARDASQNLILPKQKQNV